MDPRFQTALDLKLIRVLHLLLTFKSVSRTAEILGQSQPAVSASLKRLREVFGDPLLVRSGPHMVTTERGNELLPVVDSIREAIGGLTHIAEGFDPLTSRRHLRIVAMNCFNPFFLPLVSQLVFERAPGITLEFCAMGSDAELMGLLEDGEIDIVIGNWPSPPQKLRYAPLMSTDIVCMVRPIHPVADLHQLDMETYLTLSHLSPTPLTDAAHSPIDGKLRELHLKRHIAVTVPEYTVAPSILWRTDLVFTTGRPFAEHLASSMNFKLIKAPPELGRMSFFMLWHERAHHSAYSRWLRDLVREVASRIDRPERDRKVKPACQAQASTEGAA